MAREPFFKNWKGFLTVSVGILYVLFVCYLIFHTFQFVPPQYESYWWKIFVSYSMLNTLILGNATLRNKLFNVQFLKFLPRFLLFSIGAYLVFYFILQNVNPFGSTAYTLLSNIPVWLALVHAFVFATTESIIWQGYLDEKLGRPASCLSAGLFHFGIWSGGLIFVAALAGLLFLFFSFIHWYFRKNPSDFAPVIGVHFGYNMVKLMLLIFSGGSLMHT